MADEQSGQRGDESGTGGGGAPVIIVGSGPAGMHLALNLDALGVRSVLVNAEAATFPYPRGSTHNARTMEHLRRLGLVDRVRRLGMPADYPTSVGYFTRYNGWEIARIEMKSEGEKLAARNASATDQVVEPIFRCNQMYVEAVLLDHIRERENISLRFGWEMESFAEHGDQVEVNLVEVATGARSRLRGAFLVGCDGGQSRIRRALGIRYGGETPLQQAFLGGPMVNSYLRAPALYARLGRRFWHYWAVNREVRSNCVALDGRGEFVFSSKLLAPDDKPDERRIAQQFLASAGEEIPFEFVSHHTWTAGYALVADEYRRGRVLLAGDAVHLFTPTGAFGMNTAVDDAANLGWKLAALAQGWGGPKLLASYQAERRPIGLRNTAMSRQLARNVGAVPVGEAIEEDSPAGEAARREAGAFLANFGAEFGSLGVQLGAHYHGSPIIADDGTEPPPDEPETYIPTACPGGRAPHLWLSDGSSLFDHFDRGFTLLRLRANGRDSDTLLKSARNRGVPLKVFDVDVPEGRDLYQADLALIRPDQHVAWRGDRIPDDPEALVAHVTGW